MEILIISTLALTSLKNAEHVQYHTNVRNLITTTGLEKLGLNSLLMEPYNLAISKEQDVVNRSAASPYTLEMEEADKKRDLIFRRVRHKLQLCELDEEGSVLNQLSPTVKKNLLNKYPGSVVTLPYQEETANISGLVMDCRTLLSEEQLDAIQIQEDLTALEAANELFNQMYQERVSEKATGYTMPSVKLRAATDEAYTLLVLQINQIANDPTPANQTKVDACREMVGKINVIINDARNRLNQRTNNTAANEEEAGENGAAGNANGTPAAGSGNTTAGGGGNNAGNNGTGSNVGNGGTGGVMIPDDSMGV